MGVTNYNDGDCSKAKHEPRWQLRKPCDKRMRRPTLHTRVFLAASRVILTRLFRIPQRLHPLPRRAP